MPSIQDIAKKSKTKMFQKDFVRRLDEAIQPKQEELLSLGNDPIQSEINIKKFEKIPYRPWDEDEPGESEKNNLNLLNVGISSDKFPQKSMLNKDYNIKSIEEHRKYHTDNIYTEEKNSKKIIRSLYGVQRNIFKFLVNNISHEEDFFCYTYPIDLKSIVIFTSSSKNTVETSIRRMKEKKMIESSDHKRGRGGYVTFRISNSLREEFTNQSNKPVQPDN